LGLRYVINLNFISIKTMLLNKCYSNNSVHKLTPCPLSATQKEGEIAGDGRKFPPLYEVERGNKRG